MNETELERLVVRLLGDATSYLEMLAKSQQATQHTAQQINKHAKEVEGFGERMEKAAAGAAKAMALIGVGAGFEKMMELHEAAEKSEIRMEAMLEANGRQVEELTEQYGKYSKALAENTTLNVNEARELLTLAESFGMTADQAERAARSAAMLGKFTGMGGHASMGFIAAMEEGDMERAKAFARMIPQLRRVKDEEELVEGANRLLAAGTKLMAHEMEQADTKLTKAKQAMAGVGAEAGKLLEEGLGPLADGVLKAAKQFEAMDPQMKRATVEAIATTAAVIAAAEGVKMLWAVLSANPIGAIVTAVFLLGRGLANLTGATKEYAEAQEAMNTAMKESQRILKNELEENPNDVRAIGRHLNRLQEQRQSELNRVKAKPWWKQTVGESLDMQDGLRDIDQKIKQAEDMLKDALERRAKESSPNFMANFLKKQFTDMRKKLIDDMGKLGMSEDENALMDLIVKGLDPGKAIRLYSMIVRKEFETEKINMERTLAGAGMSELNKKQVEWMQKGIKGVELYRLKQMAEETKLREDAYQTKEGLKSPEETLRDRVGQLTKELARGMLTWDQYGRAVENAREKILGTAAPVTAATEAGTNAARVLLYNLQQQYFTKNPNVLPPEPMMNWPANRAPNGGADGAKPLVDLIKVIQDLTTEMRKANAGGAGPKVNVANL